MIRRCHVTSRHATGLRCGQIASFGMGSDGNRRADRRGRFIADEFEILEGEIEQIGDIGIDPQRRQPARNARQLLARLVEMVVVEMRVAERVDEMALPPCHCLFQFFVADGRLSCQLYQRSADIFLGVPFNIASYALLTQMIAQVTGLKPGDFVHTLGDAHLYHNHFDQAREQLSRIPGRLPTMRINPGVTDLFDFRFEDFELVGYEAAPTIRAPIAV